MKHWWLLMALPVGGLLTSAATAEESLSEVFSEGKVSGNIRAYYNTRSYDVREDEAGFALGGALLAETGAFGESDWVKLAVGYYSANDLGLNSDEPDKVNGRLGDELEVLGEAYVDIMIGKSDLKIGRQKVNTPFANPSDAFIVPMTFSGYVYENTGVTNLKLHLSLLNEFKNRNSDTFVDVGAWTTNRLTGTPTNTSGTLVLGAKYSPGPLALEGWYYGFADLFDMAYSQVNYSMDLGGGFKPFMGAQVGIQKEAGDELLGTVESTLLGLMVGSQFGKAKLTLAYSSVGEEEDAFNNGAFLAPFNFSTSPIFTNSMLQTLENVDAGDAYKVTFNYNFTDSIPFKISYAALDYETAIDREEIDIDITSLVSQRLIEQNQLIR